MYKKTALEFINKINAHDVDEIIRTISDDHVLIDAQSNELKGKDRLREGWSEYFVLFPDYAIEVEDVFEQDNKVAVFGFASGTYKGLTEDQANFWRVPELFSFFYPIQKPFLWETPKTLWQLGQK